MPGLSQWLVSLGTEATRQEVFVVQTLWFLLSWPPSSVGLVIGNIHGGKALELANRLDSQHQCFLTSQLHACGEENEMEFVIGPGRQQVRAPPSDYR